jgi:hypothetical protein
LRTLAMSLRRSHEFFLLGMAARKRDTLSSAVWGKSLTSNWLPGTEAAEALEVAAMVSAGLLGL